MDVLVEKNSDNSIQPYKELQYKYERMREKVFQCNYDYAFVVEEDVVIPDNALEMMLSIDAPVVSGVYCLRQFDTLESVQTNIEIDSCRWLKPKDLQQYDIDDTVLKISCGCMGCILIRKDALREFSFIREHTQPPDIDFASYCVKHNIAQYVHLDVLCDHITIDNKVLRFSDNAVGVELLTYNEVYNGGKTNN